MCLITFINLVLSALEYKVIQTIKYKLFPINNLETSKLRYSNNLNSKT